MKARLLTWSALLLCLLVVLAGCAVTGVPAAPAASEEMSEDMDDMSMWADVDPSGQTVTFWYQHSGSREEALQEIIAHFNDTNEYGITVEGSNQGGYGDIFSKMLNVVGTEDVPNLVVAYQNQAATYQLGDGLVDMNSLVSDPKWGLPEEEQADFFPGFYGADIFPSFGNARLGFPPNRSMEVLYFNMDWLAELGYDAPPATPEEFVEMACRAVDEGFSGAVGDESSLGYQFGFDASTIASLTFAFGGNIFDYESVAYTYDDPATIEAMNMIQGLFNDGCASTITERFGDQISFANGKLLFFIDSSSGLPYVAAGVNDGAAFDWSVAPLPRRTEDPVMNVYGASVSMGRSTPERELATWLFIKYYTSPESQAKWARASNYFPVRQSVADGLTEYFEQNPAYKTAFELLPYGTTEPPVPGYDFVRDRVQEVMAAIADGADVESTLTELTAEANEILADQ
ncbi:MAG: extracellular solute-binding protein [Caldilineaceae bacterium]|nr:extracellular solute-binding protein [Caldilineaceae bacterium]